MVILTPILKNEEWPWHLSELQVSLASSIYMLGVMGGNFVMGVIADTYGRKRPYFAVIPLLIVLQVFGTLCWSVNSFLGKLYSFFSKKFVIEFFCIHLF